MIRKIALAIGALLFVAPLIAAAPAQASDASTTYVQAVWQMPKWDCANGDKNCQHPTWPQTLVSHKYIGGSYYAGLNVDPLYLPCGSQFQVDVYVNDSETTKVLKQSLTHPNTPYQESFGGPGSGPGEVGGWGEDYQLIQTAACPVPKFSQTEVTGLPVCTAPANGTGTAWRETTTWVQYPVLNKVTRVWTYQPKRRVRVSTSMVTIKDANCFFVPTVKPPVVPHVVPPKPPVVPPKPPVSPHLLPHTGGPGLALPLAGLVAILAGGGALLFSRRGHGV